MFKKSNYVYEIYREGSFTKAAKRLGVSQPCLSAAVKNIEEKIGTEILERRANGSVTLTPAGTEYIKIAKQMMGLQETFINRLNNFDNLEAGSLRIAAPAHILLYILPEVIERFKLLYPKVKLQLTEADADSLENMISNDDIDLGVASFANAHSALNLIPIMEEAVALALPERIAEALQIEKYAITADDIQNIEPQAPPIPWEQLTEYSFAVQKSGDALFAASKEIFDENSVKARNTVTVSQLTTAYSLVAGGNHCAFFTDTFLKLNKNTAGALIYNCSQTSCKVNMSVALRKGRVSSRAMDAFIDLITEFFLNNK